MTPYARTLLPLLTVALWPTPRALACSPFEPSIEKVAGDHDPAPLDAHITVVSVVEDPGELRLVAEDGAEVVLTPVETRNNGSWVGAASVSWLRTGAVPEGTPAGTYRLTNAAGLPSTDPITVVLAEGVEVGSLVGEATQLSATVREDYYSDSACATEGDPELWRLQTSWRLPARPAPGWIAVVYERSSGAYAQMAELEPGVTTTLYASYGALKDSEDLQACMTLEVRDPRGTVAQRVDASCVDLAAAGQGCEGEAGDGCEATVTPPIEPTPGPTPAPDPSSTPEPTEEDDTEEEETGTPPGTEEAVPTTIESPGPSSTPTPVPDDGTSPGGDDDGGAFCSLQPAGRFGDGALVALTLALLVGRRRRR